MRSTGSPRRSPRPTATEMVPVPFSTAEVTRLLAAVEAGATGDVSAPETAALRKKLELLFRVSEATEKRKAEAHRHLDGVTLEAMLTWLVEREGFEALGRRIPVGCFTSNPSIGSSLTFLRRTPWAREKVEALYVELRERANGSPG